MAETRVYKIVISYPHDRAYHNVVATVTDLKTKETLDYGGKTIKAVLKIVGESIGD